MTRLLSYASLTATAFFILAVLSLHFLSPDLNPMEFGISFYALTRYGALVELAIILVGISGMMLSYAMWPLASSKPEWAGLILVIAWGLSQILAGLFPLDALGAEVTLSGRIHNLAGMNFLLITPALLLIELSRPTGRDAGRKRTIAYWLAWLLFLATVPLFIFNGPLVYLGIGGAFQRLYWLVLLSWLLTKSRQLIQEDKTKQQADLVVNTITAE